MKDAFSRKILLSLLLGYVPALAYSTSVVYNFNFSQGGTGTITYDDVTLVANPIEMDFGSFGSIATSFNSGSTASIFGTPPQEAVLSNGVFFPLRRSGENNNYASVRLYSDSTFCVQLLPETGTCVIDGTYRIAPNQPPESSSGTYSFNFSGAGTGFFTYDGSTGSISFVTFEFGDFGSSSTSFSMALTALVFGNPPSSAVIQDNTFFALSGGTAYGLRLRINGDFCVRPDAGTCGSGDLVSGSYSIARVEPGELNTGSDVVAVPTVTDIDGQPLEDAPEVVLTFDNVEVQGSLEVVLVPEDSPTAPTLPFGFKLGGSTWLYDIETTSVFNGEVTVCLPYDDASVDESTLRLQHLGSSGSWEDITNPGSPDTTNNVICGTTTSFSAFAIVEPTDADNDGLLDNEEQQQYGTDPFNPDTDDDGLNDGTEVKFTLTDPLQSDTDGDSLSDGEEINVGTDPLDADSDDDGVNDGVDPLPLTPGVTGGFIEGELRQLATNALAYPLEVVEGPNNNARKGRRNALANKLVDAANLVAAGLYADALAALDSLMKKLDGAATPPDWLQNGFEKNQLRNNILLLRGLLLLQET